MTTKKFKNFRKNAVCLLTVLSLFAASYVPVLAEEPEGKAGVSEIQEQKTLIHSEADETENDTTGIEKTAEDTESSDELPEKEGLSESEVIMENEEAPVTEEVTETEEVLPGYSLTGPEVVVDQCDPVTGEFTIRIKGIQLQAGESLQVPVWRDAGQKDIIWNKALAEGEEYIVKESVARHGYRTGTYHIHVYKRSASGAMTFLLNTSADMTPVASDIVTEVLSDGRVRATLKDVRTYGTVSQIRFAVWSKENGQDDIVWYNSSDVLKPDVYTDIPVAAHKSFGTYYVHVYAFTKTGEGICLKTATFEREEQKPSVEAFSVQVTGDSFRITASNISSALGITAIQIPVWSKADQSDIVWYTAVKEGNAYVVNSDIARHKNNRGIYHAHLYLKDASNKMHCIGQTDFEIAQATGYTSLTAEENADGSELSIQLCGLAANFNVREVKFAVWSNENGQDDLVWYNAAKTGSDYTVNIKTQKHRTNGVLIIHTYLYGEDGRPQFLAALNYEMRIRMENKVTVSGINNAAGTFDVTVDMLPMPALKYVTVAIWSKSDQSDMKWYTATVQADGTYQVRMSSANHVGNTGKFHVHAYAYDTAGNPTLIGTTTAVLEETAQVFVQEINPSEYKVTVTLPGDAGEKTEIYCPTWSEQGGQDDLKWYKAEKQADGSYVCVISRNNHLHDGGYVTDVYFKDASGTMTMLKRVNGELIQNTVFDEHAKSVMRKIIYAVETGGQVYGRQRYDAFTEAYTNSSSETAITIGAGQWFATEAKRLLTLIKEQYPSTFIQYDTAGIAADLVNADWRYYGSDGAGHRTILKGSAKAIAIQNIISSAGGIAVQDSLVDEQMVKYADQAKALGVTDLKARLFCANIQHLGGYNAMVRIINYCKTDGDPLTMENLWINMREREAGSGNKVGSDLYATRHQKVMQWLNTYL